MEFKLESDLPTFTCRFVFLHRLDVLSHFTKLPLYFMQQRFDLLVRSCVKIVGSIHVMTFVLGRKNLRYVSASGCFGDGYADSRKHKKHDYQTAGRTKGSHDQK